jgi:hypothetical protein
MAKIRPLRERPHGPHNGPERRILVVRRPDDGARSLLQLHLLLNAIEDVSTNNSMQPQ